MKSVLRSALVSACLLLCAGVATHAQRGPGGGGGGGRPGSGGMPGGGPGFPGSMGGLSGSPMSGNRGNMRPIAPSSRDTGTIRGGLQLAPPGRWWDDNTFVKSIGLRKDQQKKMDAIFNANKSSILENYKSLQREESRLEALTREPQLDKARIFAGIDAVNAARASLEKAYAQMHLEVRQEMDPDQIAKMEKFREPSAAE